MYSLIDTHSHLEQINDLENVLRRAKDAGLKAIIAVGVDIESSKKALELKERYNFIKIYATMGIHPFGLDVPVLDSISTIEENMERIIAVGEIGLDYWYKEARKEGVGRDLQKMIFQRQLDIAKKYNKPIVIHSRGAWKDCYDMVLENKLKDVLFHWYSGPEDLLKEITDKGYFLSATPSLEYSKEHQRAIKEAPIDKILLETDSPVTYRPPGGLYISEPKDVIRTLKAVSQIKGIDEEAIAKSTTENSIKFFNLDL